MKNLIIVRGASGSGKTTLSNLLALSAGYPVVSADDYFIDNNGEYNWRAEKLRAAHQYCQDAVAKHMTENKEMIFVANTFTKEWEMKPYFQLAKENQYKVFSIIVENRHQNKNVHGVPEAKVNEMRNNIKNNIKL